jgi:hypothetical protein
MGASWGSGAILSLHCPVLYVKIFIKLKVNKYLISLPEVG